MNGAYSNVCIVTRCTNGVDNAATNAVYAVLGTSGTILRVREGVNQTWAAGTDRAQKTITAPATSGYYWLELEVNGLVVTSRLLNDDLTLYDQVSYTFGTLPSGEFYGLGFGLSGNAALFDDFVIEDLEAGGGGPAPAAGRARVMWLT